MVHRRIQVPPKVLAIQKCVADYYRVDLGDLLGANKGREVARPRMMAMFLCWTLTRFSYSTIGRFFNKNHSTVMHAVAVIKALLEQYPEMEADKTRMTSSLSELFGGIASEALFLPVSLPLKEALNADRN